MCRICAIRDKLGQPRPNHDRRQRKSLDERIALLKAKKERRGVETPQHLMTPKLRMKRLRVIQEVLKYSSPEMSRLLKIPIDTYHSYVHGRRNIPLAIVELAQDKYNHIRRVQKDQKYKANKKARMGKTIVEIEVDPAMKSRVLVMYAKGMIASDIARELALRPDLVTACLSSMAE